MFYRNRCVQTKLYLGSNMYQIKPDRLKDLFGTYQMDINQTPSQESLKAKELIFVLFLSFQHNKPMKTCGT